MKDELLAALSGIYKGSGDIVRFPAQLANSAGNAMGLRSDEEAKQASQQIEDAFQPPKALKEAGEKHKTIEDVSSFVPSLVGGQMLLKTAPKAVVGAPVFAKGAHWLGDVFISPTAQRVGAAGLSIGGNELQNVISKKMTD